MRKTAILLLGLTTLPIMAASAQVLAPVGQTLGNVRGVVDDVAGPVVDRAGARWWAMCRGLRRIASAA